MKKIKATAKPARKKKVEIKIVKKSEPKNGFPFFWLVAGVVAIFLIGLGIYALLQRVPESIYVSAENPKQGDTIFIRVKSESGNIAGIFENSFGLTQDKEKLLFYKKGKSDWISFVGIDADQKPGDYKISVSTSTAELTKTIKVSLADFSSAVAVKAPSSAQTGLSNAKAVNNIVKVDNPSIDKILSKFTVAPYFSGAFSYPLTTIAKTGFSFGKFISFAKDKLQHMGVDLRAPQDTKVYAVNDGKVVFVMDLPNYGKTVIIDHGLDIFSLYLHLDNFKVAMGNMVKKGQVIGLSGDTGYVTAPHLHFSMRVGTSRVDPIAFIDATKKLNENFLLADISSAFLNLIK